MPLLTQGSLEQGSKPSKYIIKVKEPPSKLVLTAKPLMWNETFCLRPNFNINNESGLLGSGIYSFLLKRSSFEKSLTKEHPFSFCSLLFPSIFPIVNFINC